MRQLRSGTAVFSTRPDGRIAEWNPEAERLTGIRATEAEGRPCWAVLAGRDAHGGLVCHPACSSARLAREGWPVRSHELHVRTPLGEKRLTISTIVLRGEGGPLVLHPLHEAGGPVLSSSPADRIATLTPRQRQIVVLLAQGVRAREIALRLMLSETTVRNHIQAILAALGVHSQLEAAARARALMPVGDEPAA